MSIKKQTKKNNIVPMKKKEKEQKKEQIQIWDHNKWCDVFSNHALEVLKMKGNGTKYTEEEMREELKQIYAGMGLAKNKLLLNNFH